MYDAIVIGGGPAGSTLASLLLRHRPASRVLILERAPFPRFHVGETLVSEVNRVLAEMGAYDKVAAAGFPRKAGATFLWGAAEPWDLFFGELDRAFSTGGVQTATTWHIDRARYDTILLEHARSLGAELRQEPATGLIEADGRVVGARTPSGSFEARFVIDATGQAGLLGSLSEREMDPILRNVATWGYFRGFRFIPELNGSPDLSRALIAAHASGWSWAFPIRGDLASVGVVSRLADQRPGRDKLAFYREAVASCPPLARVLAGAELVPYAPGGPLLHQMADFSYISRSLARPGFARVGDAAGFVDPILSVGVFLGQSLARVLAYALNTALSEDSRVTEERALAAYAEQVRDTLGAFRELTYFFYRFNARPGEWWAEARRVSAAADLPRLADDRQAFLCFATGFAARRGVFREPTAAFDEPFFLDAYRRLVDADAPVIQDVRLRPADRVRLLAPLRCRDSAVPVEGEGRMAPAVRVESPAEGEGQRLARRLYAPPSLAPVLPRIDGQRPVSALADDLAGALDVAPAHRPALQRAVGALLAGLVARGLAEVA